MSNLIYCKVKFVRNLKDAAFETNITNKQQKDILKLCLTTINDCGFKCVELKDVDNKVIDNLLAHDLIENDFVYTKTNQGYANQDNVTIQINNENHVEIIAKDCDVYNAYKNAKSIDKILCNKIHFAYNDKYGFLTPNVKNIGSGMSVEFKIILPALSQIGVLSKIPRAHEKLRFDIRCIDRQSGLCEITTQATLGYTENQICELTKSYINKIIQLEVETSKKLAEGNDDVEDKSCRAKAILKYCKKITGSEAYVLLGNILISINSGIEKEITAEQVVKTLSCIKLYENNFQELAKQIQKIFK